MVELFNIKTKEGRMPGRSMIFATVEEAVKSAETESYADYLIYDLASSRLIDWNEIHVHAPEYEYYCEEDQSWHRIYPGIEFRHHEAAEDLGAFDNITGGALLETGKQIEEWL